MRLFDCLTVLLFVALPPLRLLFSTPGPILKNLAAVENDLYIPGSVAYLFFGGVYRLVRCCSQTMKQKTVSVATKLTWL